MTSGMSLCLMTAHQDLEEIREKSLIIAEFSRLKEIDSAEKQAYNTHILSGSRKFCGIQAARKRFSAQEGNLPGAVQEYETGGNFSSMFCAS